LSIRLRLRQLRGCAYVLVQSHNRPSPSMQRKRWGVFFVKPREKNMLHPPITIQLYSVIDSLAQVFVVPGQRSFCCCAARQLRHPPANGAIPSLPLFLPPADLPSADLPRASRCPPSQSTCRLVEQVADAVEFWLCFTWLCLYFVSYCLYTQE
jgi:hypothetical protein